MQRFAMPQLSLPLGERGVSTPAVAEGCMGASTKQQCRRASDRERRGVGRGSRCMLASGASSQARSAWLPRLTAANSSSTTLEEHPALDLTGSLLPALGEELAFLLGCW